MVFGRDRERPRVDDGLAHICHSHDAVNSPFAATLSVRKTLAEVAVAVEIGARCSSSKVRVLAVFHPVQNESVPPRATRK